MIDDPKLAATWMRHERMKRRLSTGQLAALTRAEAAKDGHLLKLSQQTISLFEQGESKRVPSWFRHVARAFNQDDVEADPNAEADAVVYIEELPTYAGAGGGGTGEGEPTKLAFSRAVMEHDLRAKPDDLLSVTIEGNSMDPDFQSGDRLLIDRRKTSLAQPGAFCLWDGDGYVVKYLERIPGSDPALVRVISRNAVFSTFERLVDEVRIMGRVVWFARHV